MKLESCSICEPCGAIFFNYSRRSSSTGRATGGARILQIRGRLFQARHSENAIAKTARGWGKGTATRDGDGRKKHAARLEERRLSCASLTSSYIRESLRPTIEPYPPPSSPPSTSSLLRYVAPVIGDVSAFLRNSLDKGGRARGRGGLYTGG